MDKIFKLSEHINFLPVVHGSGSFAKHVEAASSVGLKLNVLKLSKCGLDLDTSKDIFLYLRNYPDEAIAIQLFEWGITESAS